MSIRNFLLVPLVLGVLAMSSAASARHPEMVNRVLVDKSDRRLYLMHGDEIWKSYPIGLGFAPRGPKRRQGDGRTPEGNYVLDWRNPRSSYFLSIHISYPNRSDQARARELGVSPGGDIFIHGELDPLRRKRDWTLGCIAVTNQAMMEIWTYVSDGTPITIQP
jgi:murein L,D-transpeptidase YafK